MDAGGKVEGEENVCDGARNSLDGRLSTRFCDGGDNHAVAGVNIPLGDPRDGEGFADRDGMDPYELRFGVRDVREIFPEALLDGIIKLQKKISGKTLAKAAEGTEEAQLIKPAVPGRAHAYAQVKPLN